MKIKKRELNLRLHLFTQLESYNNKVKNESNGDKPVLPYEVLRNLAYLHAANDSLQKENKFILDSLSDGNLYLSGTDEIVSEEYELSEGETKSFIPLAKMSEYSELYNKLIEEEIDLPIYLIDSKKIEQATEDGDIDHQSVVWLANLGYIKD